MSFKNAYDSAGLNKDTEKKLKDLNPKKSSSVKGVAGGPQVEPVPSYVKADSEKIIDNRTQFQNSAIVFGRDRPRSLLSGYGGRGDTQSSAIDIVAGYQGPNVTEVTPTGERLFIDPDFFKDAARIYISQKTDVDKNFGLTKGNVGMSMAKSAIALKADSIRMISREGMKIITGVSDTNSQGADISAVKYGIDIIANNDDKDLQPIPKGDSLVKAMIRLTHHVHKLNGIVEGLLTEQDKLNKALKDHWHISTSPGMRTSPSPEVTLVASATINRHFQKTKTSLRNHRTNLKNFEKNYLSDEGSGWINSRYNKVN